MSTVIRKCRVGELRPSQVLTTFGVGAIIDLPNISVMVMGLDDWNLQDTFEVGEERLLASVRQVLGSQVQALRSAPVPPESASFQFGPFDETAIVGIPVAPFPRWMVCPFCRRLAPLSSGLFELKSDPFRPDRVRYVHSNCNKRGKAPTVVPARFVVACKKGHLDDFPWVKFVHHRGIKKCKYSLRLYELGASGEASDVEVKCETCGSSRRMADAFRTESELPPCRGRRPHLRDFEEGGCKDSGGIDVSVTAMLQGASNSWFPVLLSALAVPQASNKLEQLVDDNWVILEKVESQQNIALLRQVTPQLRDFAEYDDAEIWAAVEKKRASTETEEEDPSELKTPEWKVFSDPNTAEASKDFKLRVVPPPSRYAKYFQKVVLAERLREVRALIGFTRIESPSDYDNPAAFPQDQQAPLCRGKPSWIPASEIRGEGIFFQFSEDEVQHWVKRVTQHDNTFFEAHRRWRMARGLTPDEFYPEIRFILLHSFAHALIRQLSVECGYTSASLRERIYSRNPGGDDPAMAGVLIYTAAPDSEGTLGGLVSLGEPETLGRHLDQAIDAMRLCASDPLCAEHHPFEEGITLHGAACHACLFAPETSCERGNKYLDRSVLVATVENEDLAFFHLAEETQSVRPSSPVKPSFDLYPAEVSESDKRPNFEELVEISDQSCHAFLRSCSDNSIALPTVGFELQDGGGRVCAQAELAWPARKVAVLLPDSQEDESAFQSQGWTVLGVKDLKDNGRIKTLLTE